MHLMKHCFLCGRNGSQDRLERHHIFGGKNRCHSEYYGLVVYLCGNQCHRLGPEAAHRNKETAKMLHQYGQKKFMREQNASVEDFRRLFGRNYIDLDENGNPI